MAEPLAYLITFTCYGTWLHGDDRGSANRDGHNVPGEPYLPPNPVVNHDERVQLVHPPYHLDDARRELVLAAVQGVCEFRGWVLLAAHVRSNHAHVVVSGGATPERMMTDFKAYASRRLNEARVDPPGCHRWTRHGCTRYLWREESVAEAVEYVARRQGAPMAVFEAT